MKQNYGFKDIAAVQFNLARPNRVQLQGLTPIDKITASIDKQISKNTKLEKKQAIHKKADSQKKFNNSIDSLFGHSPLFK